MLNMMRRRSNDDGFTLIELLVVMIIIGILAAVAIPIFLNQQKTAKDTGVQADVRQVAQTIQGLLVYSPNTTEFAISERGNVTAQSGQTGPIALSGAGLTSNVLVQAATSTAQNQARVTVADKSSNVNLTKGVIIAVKSTGEPGGYLVYGWNTSSKSYATKALVYNSEAGGLQKQSVNIPQDIPNTGTGDGSTNPTNPGGGDDTGTNPGGGDDTGTNPGGGEDTGTNPGGGEDTGTNPGGGEETTPPVITEPTELNVAFDKTTDPTKFTYTVTWEPPVGKTVKSYRFWQGITRNGTVISYTYNDSSATTGCTPTQCTRVFSRTSSYGSTTAHRFTVTITYDDGSTLVLTKDVPYAS